MSSTAAHRKSGSRLTNALIISRKAKCLNTDVNILISAAVESEDAPNVIIVDDRKIFLSVTVLPILEEMIPNAINHGLYATAVRSLFTTVMLYMISSLSDLLVWENLSLIT